MSGLSLPGDGLTLVNPAGGGGSTPPGGSNLQIQWNNSGAFDGFTASGDATIDVTTGIVTVNKMSGGATFNYVAKTATYTASSTDYFIDCTANTWTLSLPTAVGRTGQVYVIKNSGTGIITVDPASTQTIDGASTFILAVQYESISIMSDGANWKVF
jgi:hypothetical protein